MTTTAPPPADAADTGETAPRPSRRLVAGIAGFTIALAAAGYALVGTPDGLDVGPGSPAAQAGGGAAHAGAAETAAMLAKLAERLQQEPNDAEGWSMLGRSYLVLGRHADAVAALEKLRALRPNDAQALVDLADAKAMLAGRRLDGEPEQLIRRALELDPRNLKALALAGTIAFDRGDYAGAARQWEAALASTDAAGELAENLRAGIAEARERGKLPAAAPGAAAAGSAPAATAAAPAAPAAAGPQVAGRVSLAPALAASVQPDDTLFVFARAVDGPKMPIAMIKRRVAELPLDFALDDSTAMNPALKLSSATQVVIGARISRSGQAIAQPGDLQGFSPPVPVGARGVQVQIGDVVR